jgi:molybdopterin converting factor subunit 1
MTVRIRLFALYRDLVGRDQMLLEVPSGCTAGEAVDALRRHTGARSLPAEPVVAVNQEYASIEQVLEDGDELALIPPVAGG